MYLDNRTNPVEFQGQGRVSFWHFPFCMHNVAATRGQYLALSKAWWSCMFCTDAWGISVA